MTEKAKSYQNYSREFKVEAVRLMGESGKTSTELATELGIRRNQLYKWRDQLKAQSEPALANEPVKQDKVTAVDTEVDKDGSEPVNDVSSMQLELIALRAENLRLKADVDTLKKAAAYFARGV